LQIQDFSVVLDPTLALEDTLQMLERISDPPHWDQACQDVSHRGRDAFEAID